jgi:hypothetical protein
MARVRWAGAFSLVLSISIPGSAVAQEQPEGEGNQPSPKVKVERTATGQKVFRITEGFVVEGRIQKPNAFYVLQRSGIDYDWETLNQGFLPKIIQATGQRPF